MTIPAGKRLGPYEILSAIGAGGMGEVYKARDTRLDRIVAIKVLPPHFADRPELRDRFEREARTIANLKHPHICVLYDIGHQNGTHYLVMEYLEGETVAERLKRGPLPLDQVLQYAIEIADALDTAHRQHFTHRDIKPANIMLTKTAGTKLLDFGLAKLKQEVDPAIPPDERPTKMGLTAQGTILGTLQYMAPEQVEGRTDDIDGRTDTFAFGAVVYEMATGKKAFEGKSQASVIAAILEREVPPMSALQPMSPPALDRVIKRCLAKDRDDRWQTARDLYQELKWIGEGGSQAAKSASQETKPAAKRWRRRMAFSAAGLAGLAITAFVVWTIRIPPTQPVSRFTITLPPGQRLAALDQPAIAISPDGKNLVYVAIQDANPSRESLPRAQSRGQQADTSSAAVPGGLTGQRDAGATAIQQLYLRPLDSLEAKPIAGTEGALSPFFSPDGQWVGFFAGGRLKKISVNGGAAVSLANTPNPGGASWSNQGILAFQLTNVGGMPLQQVSQEGGTPQPLTHLLSGESSHRWPEFLPGGKAVLFAGAAAARNDVQIAVQPVRAATVSERPPIEIDERRNLAQGTQPRYAASGHLLYAQSGTLMAAPFDARQLALTGAAVPALEGVMQSNTNGAAQYSVSSTGTLVYLAGAVAGSKSLLVWVSRNGKEQPLPAAPHNYGSPRVSPDGRRVAVRITEQEAQIWVYDVFRDTLTRVTFGGNDNNLPAWSPDGRRMAFVSNRAGPLNMFW